MEPTSESRHVPRLEKIPTGIEGFDEITGGGLPRGRITLIAGGPGSGKTLVALQTLVNAARRRDEAGVFVAFEENPHQIVANAAGFDWDLAARVDRGVGFLDARIDPETVVVGQFDLTALLAILKAKAERTGARLVVFDGLDMLLTLLDDPAAERQEVYRIRDWASETGLTCLITAKLDPDDPKSLQRCSFLQFLVDCVVQLEHAVEDSISSRKLRIHKYRGSAFAENEFPMTIGPGGVEIAGPDPTEALSASVDARAAGDGRVSTGLDRLDRMLRGGYYRGSSVLITGSPGTAKSTLAGAFLDAACRRGERALFLCFDETAHEVVRNLSSVGIRLDPYLASGLLQVHSVRTETRGAEEHLMAVRAMIRDHRPRCLAIDPVSAIIRAGGGRTARSVAQRILLLAKDAGITTVCTSLVPNQGAEERSEISVSTLVDTWIHLSYVVLGGERNRALSVIKSRGTRHSNQVRELILSDDGVSLADVYTAGGDVLMGTARWEKEQREEHERGRIRAEVDRKRREIELLEAEVKARIEVLRRELGARQAELAVLQSEQDQREGHELQRRADLRSKRNGDEDDPSS